MLLVTEIALFYQVFWEFIPTNNWVLVAIASILFILGLIIVFESVKKMIAIKKANNISQELIDEQKATTPA